MIRPFQLRDVGLLQRVSKHRIPLNAEIVLISNPHPVWTALNQFHVAGEYDTFTYVWRSDNAKVQGFTQLQRREQDSHAHILYMGSHDATANGASFPPVNSDAWLAMLDKVVAEAGRRGIQSVVAEVREDGPELPILRQAGFAVYTRQDVWLLNALPDSVSLASHSPLLESPQRLEDWDIQLLYSHLVPNMIQMVEPQPPFGRISWIAQQNGEMAAYIHVHPGSQADWLQLWVHPNADVNPSHLIAEVITRRPPKPNRPLYCCLRRYQSWLNSALEANQFEYWGSQAVMVKHTVHHTKNPIRRVETNLEMEARASRARPTMIQKWKERTR